MNYYKKQKKKKTFYRNTIWLRVMNSEIPLWFVVINKNKCSRYLLSSYILVSFSFTTSPILRGGTSFIFFMKRFVRASIYINTPIWLVKFYLLASYDEGIIKILQNNALIFHEEVKWKVSCKLQMSTTQHTNNLLRKWNIQGFALF